MKAPRLRVFAGPNGSGKSTIKAELPAAEITEGAALDYRTEDIPDWFFDAYVDEVEA